MCEGDANVHTRKSQNQNNELMPWNHSFCVNRPEVN